MLKPYSELRKIDVLPFCEKRKTADEEGKKIEVPYLNWAKCKDLLHEHGANVVYYEPLIDERTGSTVFMTNDTFVDGKGNRNRCFEVRVKIVIDDLEFVQNYPLLNGVYVVREDTINQLRVSNAQARAFVKGVAIRTGLGFGLWVSDDETTQPKDDSENLYFHDILKIKERVERLITVKLDGDMTLEEIGKKTGVGDAEDVRMLLKYYTKLYNFEGFLRTL